MRIVVKVGTSTLAHPTGRLNIQRMEKLCKVLSDLKNMGHEIILVSSGAIAMGFGKLNLSERPKDVPTKQASAAVGQCELMYIYDKLFTEYNHTVAQLLITAPDIEEGGVRKQNFHNTLARLLELGALPVINENDTISTEEFGIGDNDTLSAIVAVTIQADLLILLSDIDGLFDGDPRKNPDAKLIDTVEKIDEHIISLGGGSGSNLGTGGMATKLRAAQMATAAGCEMVIANGQKLHNGLSRALPAYAYSRTGIIKPVDVNLNKVTVNDMEIPHKLEKNGLKIVIEPTDSYILNPGVYTYKFSYVINRNIWDYDDFY